jgi:hypothetical protein
MLFGTLLPGNYWLSKSMEFTKRNSCGTLWYLKKWIVFYQFIFLKDELFEADYKEIVMIFNNFISSIPNPQSQAEAKKFFFEVDINNSFK